MGKTSKNILYIIIMLAFTSCGPGERNEKIPPFSPFDEDVTFLKKYSEVIVLTDAEGKSRIAVMPGLQARVMTSTAGAPDNLSYGWINRAFFEAGDTSIHMNAFGGEERFWLGPEGGQFSLFFPKDSAFTFQNWHTPKLIDLEAYNKITETPHSATFDKSATLTNYAGSTFNIRIQREIRVLTGEEAFQSLNLARDSNVVSVAYQSINRLENRGESAWSKNTGLLSIWLLGMFNPSPGLTMVIPYVQGPASSLGPIVNDDYFGKVPEDRLKISDSVLYFKGDGEYRSKIGLSPSRAKDVMGSYDPTSRTLTIVKYSKGEPGDSYVNSKWEIQREPYKGDVVNAYNDGPPSPGAKPMGPFYELESSSPARELEPGQHIEHTQTTFHFQGEKAALDAIALRILGVAIADIEGAFP
ncbi:MAG TPA: DUF6786 family protein [Chryseosolibacter sp.]|nr:DUF6786 family protein [Chryseosolibacter sp.]